MRVVAGIATLAAARTILMGGPRVASASMRIEPELGSRVATCRARPVPGPPLGGLSRPAGLSHHFPQFGTLRTESRPTEGTSGMTHMGGGVGRRGMRSAWRRAFAVTAAPLLIAGAFAAATPAPVVDTALSSHFTPAGQIATPGRPLSIAWNPTGDK